jgi:hypothetical protein
MERSRLRDGVPLLLAVLAAALIVSPLLVGIEPVGGDPDRLYRPIKAELASALRQGQLPFWSERFGLGIPLVAESHVAALYPPNLLLYRFLDVSTAYRVAMWLHNVLLVITTYAYARRLEIAPWGSALAALTFAFCGMQAIHSSHECFYHILPFLPLALLLADLYGATGRLAWLALLSLVLGVQWTLGHFQLQAFTNVLVLFTGLWRICTDRRPWADALGLVLATIWGASIAVVQLDLSWELARFVGQTRRSLLDLAFYSFPPAHWSELAIPRLFRCLRAGPEDSYWFLQETTGFEACLYVGTIPVLLGFVGLIGGLRNGRLAPWIILAPASFALACMPRWWPAGYVALLRIPGLGYFRCPARYQFITSLGLALLAGHGFDRALAWRRFRLGLIGGAIFGIASFAWAIWWTTRAEFQRSVVGDSLLSSLGEAALAWAVGIIVLLAWRRGRLPYFIPVLLTAAELGILYYSTTTKWGWAVPLPSSSPVLELLRREPGVGRVGGSIGDLPIRGGLTTASPYVGFVLPPPNGFLKKTGEPGRALGPDTLLWLRRFGVTHMVWDRPVPPSFGAVTLYRGDDTALDRLAYRAPGAPAKRTWHVVRLALPMAPALVASDNWFVSTEPEARSGINSARVAIWDGRRALVEHDRPCALVIARTYYPGWNYHVDGAAERPVQRVIGGLQGLRLKGTGPSRVTLSYRPTRLAGSSAVSLVSLAVALVVLAVDAVRRPRLK